MFQNCKTAHTLYRKKKKDTLNKKGRFKEVSDINKFTIIFSLTMSFVLLFSLLVIIYCGSVRK